MIDTHEQANQAANWIRTHGKKPDLRGEAFILVHYVGESREEAEGYRGGYGASVDSVDDWSDTIEYRLKH